MFQRCLKILVDYVRKRNQRVRVIVSVHINGENIFPVKTDGQCLAKKDAERVITEIF